ncbi:GAF domain-containing protein [Blastococcus sp. SYSU D00820]
MPSIAERFTAALVDVRDPALAGPELLPVRLMVACTRTLPVAGAGLSIVDAAGRRLPLGGSDEDSATAERLQFTVGAGPCLTAQETREPVFALGEDLRRRWAVYAELLAAETPYRAVAALPLPQSLAGHGALDLYVVDEADLARIDVFEALAVGSLVTTTLAEAAVWSSWSEDRGPDWLHAPAARRRAAVWQAIGRVGLACSVDTPTALALLRAAAFGSGRSVDDLAADVLDGVLDPVELRASSDADC